MRRVEPAPVVTLPVTFTKLSVQEAPAGTVTLPLMVVTVEAPPTVPEQLTSARALGVPAKNSTAAVITTASTDRIRVVIGSPPHFLPFACLRHARSSIVG